MKYIALHHTAVFYNGTRQIGGVDRYHKGKWNMKSSRGWYVGYNYFCEGYGWTTNTRKVGEETIAQVGHNCDAPERCDTISFCMAGDFRYQKPRPVQTERFRNFVIETRKTYPHIKVVGHRDLQTNRTCPELPQSYIDQFNKLQPDEDADKEKIQELQTRLDYIRGLIARMVEMLRLN